jgi:dTDP-4-dehydrorhamnose reductase
MGVMNRPAFLITGATGYLGRRLVREAESRGRVYAASRRASAESSSATPVALDVSDRSAVMRVIEDLKPTVIIHAAAVNPGQGDDATMWRVNAEGSSHVAEGARAVGSRLVAISTDVVHDGAHAPYADDADANPINHYGRSKADGESAVRSLDPAAAIVRTSLMYGTDEMDRGTAGFAERISLGRPLVLFSDVLRNPIHVGTLADAVLRLVGTTHCGTLNVAGRQVLSREAYGRKMLAYWGIASGDMVQAGRASEISDSIPLDLRLEVERAERLLGIGLAGVDEVLSSVPGGRPNPNGG